MGHRLQWLRHKIDTRHGVAGGVNHFPGAGEMVLASLSCAEQFANDGATTAAIVRKSAYFSVWVA
jgi:hypothetical protein